MPFSDILSGPGVWETMLARPKVRKEPMTVEMLKSMVESLGSSPNCLISVWQRARCWLLQHSSASTN